MNLVPMRFSRPIVRSLGFLSLLLAAVGAAGCVPFGDPEGPGASGNVLLGNGVTAADFTTLRIRAVPDDAQKAFDPAAPVFPAVSGEELPTLHEELAGLTFPHAYLISEGLGTTTHVHWRLFAWLTKSPDEGAPASGEPFGTTTFDVDSCGNYGDYCGTTEGTDITIDKTAP
ncbi:hypothetical protein [Polyangium jinanense]|uniref:Lipoprotein n=1 Tax=Polyangium jinanense TaxID=2829994 RepID=A0A9X3XCG2_9BACT|nr:hypothetical protein [Polyangium jinanense]MDC3960457.1 hypothetical protein [Polyangium jinanense]MDC3986770.1 hypothetical protein [Polyangium jinanense]